MGFVAFCFDATDRREADAARREIEEQVQLLSLATRDFVWSWDARTNLVIHNAAFGEALGEAPGPIASHDRLVDSSACTRMIWNA